MENKRSPSLSDAQNELLKGYDVPKNATFDEVWRYLMDKSNKYRYLAIDLYHLEAEKNRE